MVVSREELLAGRRIAVLATEDGDGSAYLTAVWFGVEGRRVSTCLRRPRAARPATRASVRAGRSSSTRAGPTCTASRRAGGSRSSRGERALACNDSIHRRYVTDAGMAVAGLGGLLSEGDDVTLRLVPERWQSWDMEPVFGARLSDPRLVYPLDP